MKDKKTILTVLVLAGVASVIHLVMRSQYFVLDHGGMMPFFGDDSYEESMEVNEIGLGRRYAGSEMAMVDSGMMADQMIEPMMAPMGGKMIAPDYGFMPPYYNDDALEVVDRAYQRSSYHSVVVDDASEYLRGIKEYVLSIDGRVLNSSISAGDKYESGSLYVKVPVEKFDEVTGRVTENVDKIINENINSSDVTGQLINTTESLQSLKDAKSLKEAAMKDAKTEVEKRRYQIEIERLERQIVAAEKGVDRIEQKVEYASVSITAADSERYFNPGSSIGVRYEFERAWESLKRVLRVGGYFGVWVLVYSIVWLPVVWVGKKIVRKFSNQN